jgi:flavin reductase (DIM6/NTAB) family NADH-FMN oxidoreductase RutF
MKKVELSSIGTDCLEQLKKGAFMTVKKDNKLNTMTIAWGAIGFLWSRPVFTAYVKEARYTYELLDNNKEFTISIPLNGQLNKELGFCGSQSGRVYDKFSECQLTPISMEIETPIIEECDLHFECRLLYDHAFNVELLDEDIRNAYYEGEGPHVAYYGEIINVYLK